MFTKPWVLSVAATIGKINGSVPQVKTLKYFVPLSMTVGLYFHKKRAFYSGIFEYIIQGDSFVM